MSQVPDRLAAGGHRRPTLLLVSELSKVNRTEGHEGEEQEIAKEFF
jgi:hypothetical protein